MESVSIWRRRVIVHVSRQSRCSRHQLRLSRLSVLQRLLRLGAAARGLLLLHYC